MSIHQNSLPSSPETHGAQVFWNPQPGAEDWANCVQEPLNTAINTHRAKQAKAISSSIYLMQNVTAPAILVECGFLSNPQEAARLRDPVYQTKIAAALASACLTFQGERITAHTTEI